MEKEFIESLARLFERDLVKLEHEISQYVSDSSLWKISGQIRNSGGNLALHLCGNLRQYIGKVLGKADYERNRDLEFSAKNIPATEIISEIKNTREIVVRVLKAFDVAQLDSQYPEKVFDYEMTTRYFLIHLYGHLNYHLGQVNYHRRLVGK